MTLDDKSALEYDLKSLPNATHIIHQETFELATHQWIPLKSEQQKFLKTLLPFLIQTNEPKTAEICALYGIGIEDMIKCEDCESTYF